MTAVRTPASLGAKARRLWSEVVGGFDLRPDELRLLEDACREVDVVERIEKALRDTDSLLIPGSKGQLRPNPLLAELHGIVWCWLGCCTRSASPTRTRLRLRSMRGSGRRRPVGRLARGGPVVPSSPPLQRGYTCGRSGGRSLSGNRAQSSSSSWPPRQMAANSTDASTHRTSQTAMPPRTISMHGSVNGSAEADLWFTCQCGEHGAWTARGAPRRRSCLGG